jgi:hypothetical protein
VVAKCANFFAASHIPHYTKRSSDACSFAIYVVDQRVISLLPPVGSIQHGVDVFPALALMPFAGALEFPHEIKQTPAKSFKCLTAGLLKPIPDVLKPIPDDAALIL